MILQKLLQPIAKWFQLPGDATPGAPTKELYRYMLQLDGVVRSQADQIKALEQRVTDLENP